MSSELFQLLSRYGAPAVILIAAGTIVGAVIAAVSSYVIARYNARSARQLAVDAAHRQYREQLAKSAVEAARELLTALHELNVIAQGAGAESGWHAGLMRVIRYRQKTDFRRPTDDVFAQAIEVFVSRRTEIERHLQLVALTESSSPRRMTWVLADMKHYVAEICEVLDIAAEAYVFNLADVRSRAATMLAKLSPVPLEARLQASEQLRGLSRASAIGAQPTS